MAIRLFQGCEKVRFLIGENKYIRMEVYYYKENGRSRSRGYYLSVMPEWRERGMWACSPLDGKLYFLNSVKRASKGGEKEAAQVANGWLTKIRSEYPAATEEWS